MEYSVTLPYDDPVKNARFGHRLSRSILLPPYLNTNPYFVEYADSIDYVFNDIEEQIEALKNIRASWVTTPHTEEKIETGEMLSFIDWGGPDRATVVKQTNLLGIRISNAGLVDDLGYRALAKNVGTYWFEKGKSTSINFLNYCLGTDFRIDRLWTKDYVEFVSESQIDAGRIYDDPPGPWYPTTHVQLTVAGASGDELLSFGAFFYEVANYNLVLHTLASTQEGVITSTESTQADIVQAAVSHNTNYYGIAADGTHAAEDDLVLF
jgi:hypothetical protein